MRNWPDVTLDDLQVGERVYLRSQHSIAPDAFTTFPDHEVIRLWRWASGQLQGVTLRPWSQDGPQRFVPVHHICSIARCPNERRKQ